MGSCFPEDHVGKPATTTSANPSILSSFPARKPNGDAQCDAILFGKTPRSWVTAKHTTSVYGETRDLLQSINPSLSADEYNRLATGMHMIFSTARLPTSRRRIANHLRYPLAIDPEASEIVTGLDNLFAFMEGDEGNSRTEDAPTDWKSWITMFQRTTWIHNG